jgi:hypothetical protein
MTDSEPGLSADAGRSERLESWKEIAAYLGRGVTTVQRWEQQEGLPIRRLPHAKKGSVFAIKSELDEWRRTRSQLGPLHQDATVDTPAEGARVVPPVPSQRQRPVGLDRRAAVVAVGLLALAGVTNGVLNVFYLSRIQQAVPAQLMGRAMSALILAVFAVHPVSVAAAAALARASGPNPVFVAAGASIVFAFVIGSFTRAYRNL